MNKDEELIALQKQRIKQLERAVSGAITLFGEDPMGEDVLTALHDRIERAVYMEGVADRAIQILDKWVTALGDHYGEKMEWEVVQPAWRETHDFLSEVKEPKPVEEKE